MPMELLYKTRFIGEGDSEMQCKILNMLDAGFNLLKQNLNDEQFSKIKEMSVKIDLNNEMRSRAGQANTLSDLIKINYRLHKANPEELEKTFLHELAHIVTRKVFGFVKSHGHEWQSIMKKMNQEPERCHSMDTSELKRSRTKRRFIYTCRCSDYLRLSPVRHNKMVRGIATYNCRRCGQEIVFTGKSEADF
jgi:SprT protein